jgi:hypothetical protein
VEELAVPCEEVVQNPTGPHGVVATRIQSANRTPIRVVPEGHLIVILLRNDSEKLSVT